MALETSESGTLKFNAELNVQFEGGFPVMISQHATEQIPEGYKHLIHAKLNSYWFIKESTGVKFLVNEPTWNYLSSPISPKIVPGIFDFKYQRATNVNMFFQRKNLVYKFLAGTPMAHIIPLSDKNIEIKKHLVSYKEWLGSYTALSFRDNRYARYKKMIDGKCPFSSTKIDVFKD
jgi:hypothetical protein